MVIKYAQTIIKWRWLVLLMTVLWVGMAASGGRFLAFTTDYRAFFAEGNPQLQAFEAMQDTYDKSDNVLMVITPKDGKVFTKKTLEQIRWMTEQAWQVPFSTRVDSISNYQHTRAFDDDLEVGDLVGDTSEMSSADLLELQTIATTEPLLVNRLINKKATVTAINVTTQLPGKSLSEVPEVVAFSRDLAKQLDARDANIEVRLTGIMMLNNAFGESSQNDMATLVPLMFLVVIVVLGVLLRSVSATIISVVVIFMSILVGMGMFGWAGFKLTPPSASAPTIILTMAVADAVHILVTFIASMRLGMIKQDAMIESLRVNMQPILLTSVTTIIGFMTMNFSDVPPLVHLGNIVAVGVFAAFVLSVTVLPALAVILPFKVKKAKDVDDSKMHKFSSFVIKNNTKLLYGMAALSVLMLTFIPNNELNDEYVKYFDESLEFRADTDYSTKHLIGPYTIEYSLKSGEDNGISEPAFLNTLNDFVNYSKTLPEVLHVNSLTDIMTRLNKNMHGDDPSWYVLPDQRDLAAQYLLLYEMSLPYGLDLNNQIDIAKSSTRVTMSLREMSSAQMLALEQNLNNWLQTNAPQYDVDVASTSLMFSHIGKRNAQSLVGGAVLALILISMILIFALRSVKMGLVSLVPNLVPVGIAFGAWGILSAQIGLSVSIVAGMTLGIVVDDTVHFLSKYMRAKREKQFTTEEAIHYAFANVGSALMVTTAVLVTGFSVLMFSTFRMNSDMGLLTAITIAVALAVDFLLLPPLLIKLEGKKDEAFNTVKSVTT
ncbi:MAG: MMPL family transporter [Psychrosphaera sp.]|nr:MMPL family transporter [Psychrosphaera sp.]